MRLPTRLDRYPGKMVSSLADTLVERYAAGARRLLDPFCGSGAILLAGARRNIPVTGIDINPLCALFASVKLKGFDPRRAQEIAQRWIIAARRSRQTLPVDWNAKRYWFTPLTLSKFELLRQSALRFELGSSPEGQAVLLSYVLSVRLCSRADQRSPKPFISKLARASRSHRHFDPYMSVATVLEDLSRLYGAATADARATFVLADLATAGMPRTDIGKYSHVITSPPYVNAQDYFRNFKCELHLLEGILPFKVRDLRERFIGTERGDLLRNVPEEALANNSQRVPELTRLTKSQPRLAAVVHRYLFDMGRAFESVRGSLEPGGRLVVVCGDNLIGGIRIRTWEILQHIVEDLCFRLYDRFVDRIGDRLLAPKRSGHKGLIKEEVVSAYHLALPTRRRGGHQTAA